MGWPPGHRRMGFARPIALVLANRRDRHETGQHEEGDISAPDGPRPDDAFLAHVDAGQDERVVQDDDRQEARDERAEEVAPGEEQAYRRAQQDEAERRAGQGQADVALGLKLAGLAAPALLVAV